MDIRSITDAINRLCKANAEYVLAEYVARTRGWDSDHAARIEAEIEVEAARESLNQWLFHLTLR